MLNSKCVKYAEAQVNIIILAKLNRDVKLSSQSLFLLSLLKSELINEKKNQY